MSGFGQRQMGVHMVRTGSAGDKANEQERLQRLVRFAAMEVLPRGDFSEQEAMGHAVVDHEASPGCFLVVTEKCRTLFAAVQARAYLKTRTVT